MDMLTCELPGIPKIASGKVREIFDVDHQTLLLVATDRISAFDCVLPNPIPNKGKILTQISSFWFQKLDFVPNHLLTCSTQSYPEALRPYEEMLSGRSMLIKKAVPLPVECIARGYLAGSAWKEYQTSGTVCGQNIPPGLQQSDRFPSTLFTPTTKATSGHDQNMSWKECRALLGEEIARQVRDWTIELYEYGSAYAATRGILIADTKFEFGLIDDQLILIDECLTPDSSRFWPTASHQLGISPPSFDKQFVRDYLESIPWNKMPPAPSLPEAIVAKTAEKYQEAYTRLTATDAKRRQ